MNYKFYNISGTKVQKYIGKVCLFDRKMQKTGKKCSIYLFVQRKRHIFVSLNIHIYYCFMKRKDLKKHINYLCGELLAECIAAAQYSKKANKQDIENVMLSILGMQNDWICRLSHVEPGSTRLFFKKLRDDMQKRTDEIIDQIQNLAC